MCMNLGFIHVSEWIKKNVLCARGIVRRLVKYRYIFSGMSSSFESLWSSRASDQTRPVECQTGWFGGQIRWPQGQRSSIPVHSAFSMKFMARRCKSPSPKNLRLWGMYKCSEPIRLLHSVQKHMAYVYSSEVCLQTKKFPKISKFFFQKHSKTW